VSPEEARDNWYFHIKALASDYEINVDHDMASKDTMTIFINHKVHDYKGNYIGATGVGLAIHAVKKRINTYQERYHRTIFFTDKNGVVTLHGDNFPKTLKNIFDIKEMANHKGEIIKGKSLSFQYRENGQTVYINNRYIPEFNWYLFVEQRGDAAIQKIRHTLILNLLFSFVITALILILTNMTISSYQKRLTNIASTDKLTGIYNRRAFDIIIDQALKDVQREQRDLSLILFDIDHFKKINDTYGHLAGDCMVQKVVETTIHAIRNNDIICRWGGDEFLIILKGCRLKDAITTAEKIRKEIKAYPALYQEKSIYATVSLGVTEYARGDTKDSLLNRADSALYAAKAGGRDRCETAPEQPCKADENQ